MIYIVTIVVVFNHQYYYFHDIMMCAMLCRLTSQQHLLSTSTELRVNWTPTLLLHLELKIRPSSRKSIKVL